MKKLARVLVVVLLAALAACSKPPTGPTPSPETRMGTVQLTVAAGKGAVKGPIAGVMVSLVPTSLSASTNEAGIAKLSNVTFGDYTFSATSFGFVKATGSIKVNAESVESAVSLVPVNVVELNSVFTEEDGPISAGGTIMIPATLHLRARYNSTYEGSDLLVSFTLVGASSPGNPLPPRTTAGTFVSSQDIAPGVRETIYRVVKQPCFPQCGDSAGLQVSMGPNLQPSLADLNLTYPLRWVAR